MVACSSNWTRLHTVTNHYSRSEVTAYNWPAVSLYTAMQINQAFTPVLSTLIRKTFSKMTYNVSSGTLRLSSLTRNYETFLSWTADKHSDFRPPTYNVFLIPIKITIFKCWKIVKDADRRNVEHRLRIRDYGFQNSLKFVKNSLNYWQDSQCWL